MAKKIIFIPLPTSRKWEVFNKHQYNMLKTLNFIRKLNKKKKKAIWSKTSHFREGKRKLPALFSIRDLF
jgi:hypothetical protein